MNAGQRWQPWPLISVKQFASARRRTDIVPRVRSWIVSNFPDNSDRSTAIALALEEVFGNDLEMRDEII